MEGDSSSDGDVQDNPLELLNCVICFQKLVDAHMCPHCSKLGCLGCMKRWLESHPSCPTCRAPVKVHQLVNCRFIGEVTAELDKMRSAGHMRRNREPCSDHPDLSLDYYCEMCSMAVCADCSIFDKHRGHSFRHIEEIYSQHAGVVRAEAEVLNEKIREISDAVLDVESNMTRVTKAKEEKLTEIAQALQQMQNRLEVEYKQKMDALRGQKKGMSEDADLLQSMLTELSRQLARLPKSQLIGKSSGMISMLHQMQVLQRPVSSVREFIPPDFTSEVAPGFTSGIFRIQGYTALRTSPHSDVIYSSPLHASGLSWRLKVYPNGNGVARGTYLSVFLELMKGLPESSKYEYRVEMENHRDATRLVSREFASEFEVGECWGYNRFFRIDLLAKEGFLSNDADEIVLRYHVRAPTFYQHCRDQERWIAQLEDQNAELRAQLAALKQSTEPSSDEDKSVRSEEGSLTEEEESSAAAVENPPQHLDNSLQHGEYPFVTDEELELANLSEGEISDTPVIHQQEQEGEKPVGPSSEHLAWVDVGSNHFANDIAQDAVVSEKSVPNEYEPRPSDNNDSEPLFLPSSLSPMTAIPTSTLPQPVDNNALTPPQTESQRRLWTEEHGTAAGIEEPLTLPLPLPLEGFRFAGSGEPRLLRLADLLAEMQSRAPIGSDHAFATTPSEPSTPDELSEEYARGLLALVNGSQMGQKQDSPRERQQQEQSSSKSALPDPALSLAEEGTRKVGSPTSVSTRPWSASDRGGSLLGQWRSLQDSAAAATRSSSGPRDGGSLMRWSMDVATFKNVQKQQAQALRQSLRSREEVFESRGESAGEQIGGIDVIFPTRKRAEDARAPSPTTEVQEDLGDVPPEEDEILTAE